MTDLLNAKTVSTGIMPDTVLKKKRFAARLSFCSNVVLMAIKFAIGLMSGSVSVLSEAAHSGSDVVASSIALFSVRLVDLPPDEKHPYGHGKAEGLSTLGQGALLLGVATYIIFEAAKRLVSHDAPQRVEWGMLVMLISAMVNVFVARHVVQVANQTDSMVLRAVSKDHLADIYAATGVLVGLLLVRITGLSFFDPLLAIAVALLIVHSGAKLIQEAIVLLMDSQLPAEEVAQVEHIFNEERGILGYHKLRTRRSGSTRHVDAHILLNDDMTLLEAHEFTEAIESRIREALPGTEVTLHMEPHQAELQHQQQAHESVVFNG